MIQILLIEDDELLRRALHLYLKSAGFAVTVAGDGQQGIRLFRAAPADLIITDIMMPEEDGLGIIMTLRKKYPEVRIIAMSGDASFSPNWLAVAAKLGAVRTLAKPFTLARLGATITEAIGAPELLLVEPR